MLLASVCAVLAENNVSFSYDGDSREILVTGSFHITRIRSDKDGIYIIGKDGTIELAISEIVDYIHEVG